MNFRAKRSKENMHFSLLYVPCASKEEALNIAYVVIKEKLAACANILDSVISVYDWQNTIQESTECLLLLKTKKGLVPVAREKIIQLHSYKIPCVVEIELSSVNLTCAEWLHQQCLPT